MEPEMVLIELIFQSTLPAWGATRNDAINIRVILISIHAPRMGSDHNDFWQIPVCQNFNPRSPHGERHPVDH